MTNKDSVRTAINRLVTVVIAEKLDHDGTANYFETDQAVTDTPTLLMDISTSTGEDVSRFEMTSIKFMINPTNAVTYQLFLLEDAQATDPVSASHIIFDSAAAMVDSTVYEYREGVTGSLPGLTTVDGTLPHIVNLVTANTMYYMLDWSGAPGDTLGYIKIRGKLLK